MVSLKNNEIISKKYIPPRSLFFHRKRRPKRGHSNYKNAIFEKGGKFNPNEEMTRETVAVAISKAFKLQSSGQLNFTDVPTTSSAYNAIVSLAEHDITVGFEQEGVFKETHWTEGKWVNSIYFAKLRN